MARHGSGYDLGLIGELVYRRLRRLPPWIGFSIPFGVFVASLEAGEALVAQARTSTTWLDAEWTYALYAFGLVPVIAFSLAYVTSQLVFLTYVSTSGRWTLLRLNSSLREIRSLEPREFERLVGAVYEQRGYEVDFPVEGRDGGFDLLMRNGSDKVLVQCKNWNRSWTGVAEVRELFGVITAEQASRGIFVTSGVFSEDAIAFAQAKPLELLDGEALLDMIDAVHRSSGSTHNKNQNTRTLRGRDWNRDLRCPICGAPTVRKKAHRGENAGTSFWSCSRFPDCMGIAPG